MGRYLDVVGDQSNPLQGLSLDHALAPALATINVPVAAVASPSNFQLWAHGVDNPLADGTFATFGALGTLESSSQALTQARQATHDTSLLLGEMAPFVGKEGKPTYASPVTYPATGGEFPARLAGLAAMLAAGMPIRCAALTAVGSYDTHAEESETLATNLSQTLEAVLAFQRDLEARGLADRVLIQLWSEFGRRPKENGSGTDHGAAGVAFLLGNRVREKWSASSRDWHRSTSTKTSRARLTSARCTARCSSNGSTPKPL